MADVHNPNTWWSAVKPDAAEDTLWDAHTAGEVSVSLEFVAAEGADQAIRRAMGNMKPSPPSVTMARWPNALGETPADAIGKTIRLELGGRDTVYVVDHIYGEALILRRAS